MGEFLVAFEGSEAQAGAYSECEHESAVDKAQRLLRSNADLAFGGVFMRTGWIMMSMIVGFATFATGCVVNEPESPTRGVVVSGPPPAPVREERPPPPNPQALWVGGYWHWTGMQYAWIPGHWEAPPAGVVWAAPRVTTTPDGRYVYESGGWRDANGGNRNSIR